MMEPTDLYQVAAAARRAREALTILGPAIEEAAASLRLVTPHLPPPGPMRRGWDRVNLWAGAVCARPECDRPACRRVRARREHRRAPQ